MTIIPFPFSDDDMAPAGAQGTYNPVFRCTITNFSSQKETFGNMA